MKLTRPRPEAHPVVINAMATVDASQPKSRWLVLKAGLVYFAIVFTAGFGLGIVRVLWAIPRFGTRTAELMEMPFMLVATILAALWVVRRLAVPSDRWTRLGMGLVALGCVLLAELSVVLQLRGLSIAEYLSDRDPVSGTVYLLMLGLFALMPWLVASHHHNFLKLSP